MATSKKQNNVIDLKNDNILTKEEGSGVVEFVKRQVPSENQVEDFESYLDEEGKKTDIEDSLSEIYQDEDGQMVDVRKLDIKKKRGILYWLALFAVFGALFFGGKAFYEQYVAKKMYNNDIIALTIEAREELVAGEEFVYDIKIENKNYLNLRDAVLELNYPSGFIYKSATIEPNEKNNKWLLGVLQAASVKEIRIKGVMIGKVDSTNVLFANLRYQPENFNSEFKKESSISSTIKETGLAIDFIYSKTIFEGEQSNVDVQLRTTEKNYLKNFKISMEIPDNIDVSGRVAKASEGATVKNEMERPGTWFVSEVSPELKILPLQIKLKNKKDQKQSIKFNFEYIDEAGKPLKFEEKSIDFDVLKNSVNLNTIINGSTNDQGINFGETLNYTITFANKGDSEVRDVVLMAVLEGDVLDWTTLKKKLGKDKGNMITWTKEDIPELAVLEKNKEGSIDFSIKTTKPQEIKANADYLVRSYAQFGVAGSATSTGPDNRSNIIVNKINSDLDLIEQVRYFDADNIPVGTGPNPPKAGETTSYKVFWEIKNSLHELGELVVVAKLPDNVMWWNKKASSVGTLDYNEATREITWNIGRLPSTVMSVKSEFGIQITPTEADKNRIMVLLPGSSFKAVDTITKAELSNTTKAQTTQLEADEIGRNDGLVK